MIGEPSARRPRLDVPRVVLHRMVRGQLERRSACPAGSSSRPARTSMIDIDLAVEVPRTASEAVGQRVLGDHDPVARSRPRRGWRAEPVDCHRDRGAPVRPVVRPCDIVATAITSRRAWVVGVGDATRRAAPAMPTASAIDRLQRGDRRGRAPPRHRRATQAIDEPGMMSWNCCSSTSFHSSSSSVDRSRYGHRTAGHPPQLGLAEQPLAAAIADLGRRLDCQRAAVHLEVQLAVPHRDRCAGGGLGFDVSKNSSGVPTEIRGTPSRSAMRRARSIISRVGPPPPLP